MGSSGCCIGDCCVVDCGFCCIFDGGGGGGCGYHPGPNENEKHAQKIAEELAKMKEHRTKVAEKAEEEVKTIVKDRMDGFIAEIKKVNENSYGSRSLNINIKGIEEQRDALLNQIPGTIGGVLYERLTLTDKELSVILAERNDEARDKAFQDFCNNLEKESKEKLKKKIKEVVKEQQELVAKEIKNRLAEVEGSMNTSIKELERVKDASDKGTVEKEKEQLELMYKHGIYDLLASKLDI